MARPLRIEYVGAFYHVFNRGLERRTIFADARDYRSFLSLLEDIHGQYNIRIYSYCLMPNHYHLYLETPDGNLSRAMRHLDGVYTQRFNKRNKRVGPLLQGRYKSVLVEKENYSLEISRYIHLNPVRAKMVENPHGWEWSSYNLFMGKHKKAEWLDIDWILSQFSKKMTQARKLFEKFTLEGLKEAWELDKQTWKGMILGSENFIQWVRTELVKGKEDPEIPDTRKIRKKLSVEEVEERVREITHEPSLRKKLLMYGLKRYAGLPLNEIGQRVGGIKYTAVSMGMKRLEEAVKREKEISKCLEALKQICEM